MSTTTERNEILLPKSETIGASVAPTATVISPTSRPSLEHKRTQKFLNSFSTLNLNTNPNRKSVAATKDRPKLKSAFRPASDYDYYDDGDSVIGRSTSKVSVFPSQLDKSS